MGENIFVYFMHTLVLFILSLVFLLFNTTFTTSFAPQLVAAAGGGGAANKCIDKERRALLDFKAQLQDPKGRLSTWRSYEEDNCCEWSGITCSDQGHVTKLGLNYYGLGGEIRLSLLNLTFLKHLDLSLNSFHGTIPQSIGKMTRLTFLNLGYNLFSGTIPIGSLSQLNYLYLDGNNFSGTIPRSIGSLTQLKSLDLSNNSFSGTFPTEFGNLSNLENLFLDSLRSCTVENLNWLSSLSSLETLSMDGTSLAKVSNWVNVIIDRKNLSFLSLKGCDLSHVLHPYSSSVNSTSNVHSLFLHNNNLNESMYHWLCPLFGDRLRALYLSGNTFYGKLSDFLSNLSGTSATIQELEASNSQFTGSLSDEIQNFSSLKYLDLSSNKLNGTISEKLWQLSSLQRLRLSSNSLGGSISENIVKLNLVHIDLSDNSFEGAPSNDDVSNLSMTVEYIDVSSNKLGPRFPKWIQKLKNLMHLDLSNNSISDTIPTDNWNHWCSSKLNYLDLSFNNISGSLPAFSGRLSFLDLSRNKFQGRISILCQISEKIEFLDLSRNSLTGQLPDCLKNLTYLRVLNLGHNALSGSIPPSIGCLSQLETLCLYNNSFSGGLPLSLKNCTKLSLLDLGANNLNGNIPVWIGKNLSRLYALSLKSNNFFGTIPSQICQLVSLQILDLSFNNLHGKIPPCVNNLTSMVQKGFFLEQNKHHYRSIINLTYESYSVANSYIDHLLIEWQGKVNEFSSLLGLVKAIDLSSNNLTGQIPNEVTNLYGLLALDLSNNSLVGEIPRNIGQMRELLTLNLSRNMFSGEMPSSMSNMYLLNDLDVSFNNLSGRVPSSTQLQSFEPARFTGNAGLCGLPTTRKCLGDDNFGVPDVVKSESDGYKTDELQRWFYVGGATGFATGFWIVCSALLLNRRGRRAFFSLS